MNPLRAAPVVLLLLLPLAQGQPVVPDDPSPTFGAAGAAVFNQYSAPPGTPGAGSAGEPTLGIPWNTDSVFYQAGSTTYRLRFDADSWDGDQAAPVDWVDVTPTNSIVNVDPMLHADPDLGRVWAGGLAGPCSIMSFSDDDGETWTPTGNMCSGAQFDHQSIGSGPHAVLPAAPVFEHATYYCAQLLRTACATSLDGGVSWGPFNQVLGACGGLHGHIRVSHSTGLAVVPHKNCGGNVGFAYTTDGVTWDSRTHPEAPQLPSAFDPSIQFGRGEGWMWMGQAAPDGAFIALSKDDGSTWEPLAGGQANGRGQTVEATTWLDVGQFHDPPVVKAEFADVQVGDDDRVAFSFLGLVDLDGDGTGDEYASVRQCDDGQADMVWHYFVALSYDAGATWSVQRVTPDPVQIGGIWLGQGGTCRNLLDFNDMDLDSQGRIHISFADGCTEDCAEGQEPGSEGHRTRYAALLRQETGQGLFADFDTAGNGTPSVEPTPEPVQDTPLPWALAVLGLAIAARRR